MVQFRQGDVFIERIAELPAKAKRETREGDIILAHGEATGHAHRIKAPFVTAYSVGEDRFIRVQKRRAKAFVDHEEHAPIELPPGIYRVRRQREYIEGELRQVAD